MEPVRTCSKCGGSIPPEAPAGLCPHCLLDLGLEPEQEEVCPVSSPDEVDAEIRYLKEALTKP